MTRTRSCDSPAPANGGDDCEDGDESQSESCNSNPCKGTRNISII